MKNKVLCALLIAGMVTLAGCSSQADATQAGANSGDAVQTETTENTTEDNTAAEDSTQAEAPAADEDISNVEGGGEMDEYELLAIDMADAVPEEMQEGLRNFLDNQYRVASEIDMDSLFQAFLYGNYAFMNQFDGMSEELPISCFYHFAEGYGDLWKAESSFKLQDIDNDGTDELFYQISDGYANRLYFVLKDVDDRLLLLELCECFSPYEGAYLTKDGHFIYESHFREADMDCVEVSYFDTDGSMNHVECLYASDYENYDEYDSAATDLLDKYHASDENELTILSEKID